LKDHHGDSGESVSGVVVGNDIYAWQASGRGARVAEPGTATEPMRFGALGVEPRDRNKSDQVSCWSSGPRGFKSHPGRLITPSADRSQNLQSRLE